MILLAFIRLSDIEIRMNWALTHICEGNTEPDHRTCSVGKSRCCWYEGFPPVLRGYSCRHWTHIIHELHFHGLTGLPELVAFFSSGSLRVVYLNGWVEEIYLNRRLEVIQFWEITWFFVLVTNYSSTMWVDIGIWSYSAVSRTSMSCRWKKNSIIKLLFVNQKV